MTKCVFPKTPEFREYNLMSSYLPEGQQQCPNGRGRCQSYVQTGVIRLTDAMRIHHNVHICSLQSPKMTRNPYSHQMDNYNS